MKVLSDGYVMCYVCFVFHICFYPDAKLCLHFLRSIKKSDNDQSDHYQIYKMINFNTATLSEWSLWPLWLMDTLSLFFLFYMPHNRSTVKNAAVHTTILCDIAVFCHTKQNNVIIFCKYCATHSTLPRTWKCFQQRLQGFTVLSSFPFTTLETDTFASPPAGGSDESKHLTEQKATFFSVRHIFQLFR